MSGQNYPKWPVTHISGSSYADIASNASRFFRFGEGRPLHNVRSLFSRSGGRRPLHTVQSLTFRNLWTFRFLASRTPNRKPSCRIPLMSSRSRDAAAVFCKGPLFRFFILGPSSISSWTSVPLGFSAQSRLLLVSEARVPCVVPLLHCGSSSFRRRPIYSGIPNFPRCEFSWRSFPCSVSLLHDGTPSCRRQPTSSGIPNLLGSVPLALRVTLQLDAGPCAVSSLGTSRCSVPDSIFSGLASVAFRSAVVPSRQTFVLASILLSRMAFIFVCSTRLLLRKYVYQPVA
jgi:hypothetical protein